MNVVSLWGFKHTLIEGSLTHQMPSGETKLVQIL